MGDRKNFLPLFHRRASEQRERNCSGGSVESRRSAGAGRRVFARSCVRQLGRNETHRNDEPLSNPAVEGHACLRNGSPTLSRTRPGGPTWRTKTMALVRAHPLRQNPSASEQNDRVHWTATAMYVAKTDSRSGSLEYNKVPVVSGVKLLAFNRRRFFRSFNLADVQLPCGRPREHTTNKPRAVALAPFVSSISMTG